MEIQSASFRIKDNYGLLIEVKPLTNIASDEALKDISSFFEKYRIVSAYKDINIIDKHKEELSKIPIHREISSKQPRPSKFLPMNQLVNIVKTKLQSPFGMMDFINELQGDPLTYGNYTYDDIKHMWKSVHAHLTTFKKIEIVNKESPKTQYKYKYVGLDDQHDRVSHIIRDIMNGEKAEL